MHRSLTCPRRIRRISTWSALSVVLLAGRVTADDSAELEIEDVLTRWAEASVMEGAFEIRLESYEYDSTFGTETRHSVRLRGDGEGAWEYRTDPVLVTNEFNEQKLTSNGEPYRVRQGRSTSWIVTSDMVISADHESRTTATLQRHADGSDWLAELATPPLRLALNMTVDVDELQRDFHWEIADPLGPGLHIIGRPREERLALQVSSVELILDEATWLPLAYREISGGTEYLLMVQERIVPIDFDWKTAFEAVSEYTEL